MVLLAHLLLLCRHLHGKTIVILHMPLGSLHHSHWHLHALHVVVEDGSWRDEACAARITLLIITLEVILSWCIHEELAAIVLAHQIVGQMAQIAQSSVAVVAFHRFVRLAPQLRGVHPILLLLFLPKILNPLAHLLRHRLQLVRARVNILQRLLELLQHLPLLLASLLVVEVLREGRGSHGVLESVLLRHGTDEGAGAEG